MNVTALNNNTHVTGILMSILLSKVIFLHKRFTILGNLKTGLFIIIIIMTLKCMHIFLFLQAQGLNNYPYHYFSSTKLRFKINEVTGNFKIRFDA